MSAFFQFHPEHHLDYFFFFRCNPEAAHFFASGGGLSLPVRSGSFSAGKCHFSFSGS